MTFVIAVIFIVALFAQPLPDESTPWDFLRNAVVHFDSAGKIAGAVFFTIVLMGMNLIATLARLRLGLMLPVVLLGALAVMSARVRRSWLVRIGFGLGALAVVPLVTVGALITDNPVGLGFLFAFLTPIAALMILGGAVLAVTAKESHDPVT